jgi:hypothetical protein
LRETINIRVYAAITATGGGSIAEGVGPTLD